jgi:hypothetical protein
MIEQELALSIFKKKYEEWSTGTERSQNGYIYEKLYQQII